MIYVTYSDFTSVYGGAVGEDNFNIFAFEACQLADKITTGVDGIRKLRIAFPSDEDDAEAIKRAICDIILLMAEVKALEANINASGALDVDENGNLRGKVVSSVSSGSESIHFATMPVNSIAGKLATDTSTRQSWYSTMLVEAFRGIKDNNGINLLYLGAYPME